MNSYRYVQRYRPIGDVRAATAALFVAEVLGFLGCGEVVGADGTPIPTTQGALQKVIHERRSRTKFPECGIDVDLFTTSEDARSVSRFEFHLGTQEGEPFVDFMALQIGQGVSVVDASLMKRLLALEESIEAFLAENNNEFALEAKKRQNRFPDFSRPALIRGLHFLGSTQVANLGGISRCVAVPAFRVEALGGGVLVQLVEGTFDPGIERHRRAQQVVMESLGILST